MFVFYNRIKGKIWLLTIITLYSLKSSAMGENELKGECKFCKKEIVFVAGRRKREYCNDSCKIKFFHRNKKKEKAAEMNTEVEKVAVKEVPKQTADDSGLSFFERLRRKKLGM